MNWSRRQILEIGATAGGALFLGWRPGLAQGREILRRPIPSSGERIPVMGLGTARTFSVGTSSGERAPLKEVLRLFSELGGTLLDTAPSYGTAEAVSGDLIRELGLGDSIFVATKVRARGRDEGIEQMQGSLRRLIRNRLDLMQVHNLVDIDTQLATMRAWKAEGKIRYLGMTTSSVRQFDAFESRMRQEDLDFVQLNYSIGMRQADERLLPLAADRGMAVLVNLPYLRGRVFQQVGDRPLPDWVSEFDCNSWGQFFLKWVVSHPSVTVAIPATSKPHHLRDNMGAAYGRLPDAAMRRRMAAFFDDLA